LNQSLRGQLEMLKGLTEIVSHLGALYHARGSDPIGRRDLWSCSPPRGDLDRTFEWSS
jgi:hypothetical protein